MPQSNFLNLSWNLNSLINSTYISFLADCLSVNKFNIVFLSEIFINYEVLTDDDNLQIPGYSFTRENHLCDTKRGGVCIYYRNSLPLKLLDIKYL